MKIIYTVIVSILLSISLNAEVNKNLNKAPIIKPYYQGKIIETLHTKGYTYLLIAEKVPGYKQEELKSFWIVVTRTQAKVGDHVRFHKEIVMKDYSSKSLNKTFTEIMFASGLEYRVTH